MADPLTLDRFLEIHPQFAGVSADAMQIIQQQIDYANIYVCCDVWGVFCERGRALLAAHYASQFIELLADAEDDPSSGGGTITSSNRISAEKVGEVEIKFHKPSSLNAGFSNEHNDPISEDLKDTLYGKQFLALQRRLGLLLITTSKCFR